MENGQDDIEGVRLVRDNETLKGKGIGYILFKERDCVLKALSKNGTVYKKRWELRVNSCGKRTKRSNDGADPRPKKPKFKVDTPALRRIKLKGVETKKKLLTKRNQKGGNSNKGKKAGSSSGGKKKANKKK